MPWDERPDPTPEEIRERCLEIQASWSALERAKRAGMPVERTREIEQHKQWLPPVVSTAEIDWRG